jgi:hypothetical protein
MTDFQNPVQELARLEGRTRRMSDGPGRAAPMSDRAARAAKVCVAFSLLTGCFHHGLLLNDRGNAHDVDLAKEGAVCLWISSEKVGFYEIEVEHAETGNNWLMDMNPLVDQRQAVPIRQSAPVHSEATKNALQASYLLYQLPPGTYQMAYFRRKVDDWKLSLMLKPSRFTIRAGEITYIGTYELHESAEKGILFDRPTIDRQVGLTDAYEQVREALARVPHLGIDKLPVRKELAPLELQHPLDRLFGTTPAPADGRRPASRARQIGVQTL